MRIHLSRIVYRTFTLLSLYMFIILCFRLNQYVIISLQNKSSWIAKISGYNQKALDIMVLQGLFPHGFERNDRVLKQLKSHYSSSYERNYTILLWDSYSHDNGKNPFKQNKCKMTNCILSRNKKLRHSADAIVFKYESHEFVEEYKRDKDKFNPNQVRIISLLESPYHSADLTIMKDVINWTATYRRDSVINTPYERFTYFDNHTGLPDKSVRNYATGKTKLVAWFVSNCDTRNRRENYVKELKKYIQVDIYGYCGHYKCDKGEKVCFSMLSKYYKFYLSFENSNCKDYITEKFFVNGLQNDVLPIVMGARPEDYIISSPPQSYIHVDDFDSPKHLAEYLHKLNKNDDLYNQYFRWKGTGGFINTKFTCRLCALVNIASLIPVWYTDVNEWWRGDGICVKPKYSKRWATWKNVIRNNKYTKYIQYGNNEIHKHLDNI